jgi:hypothetical protein
MLRAIFARLEDIRERIAADNPTAATRMIEADPGGGRTLGGITRPRPVGSRGRHTRTRHPAHTVCCALSGHG